MKKYTGTLLLGLLITLTGAALASCAYAEDNPLVWTYDENGDDCDVFNVGDKVGIKAYSKMIPYHIYVFDPDGDQKFHAISNTENYDSGLLANITDELGWWEARAGTVDTHFACGYYLVIPEVPLGVLAVLGACFAGLGIKRIRRK